MEGNSTLQHLIFYMQVSIELRLVCYFVDFIYMWFSSYKKVEMYFNAKVTLVTFIDGENDRLDWQISRAIYDSYLRMLQVREVKAPCFY